MEEGEDGGRGGWISISIDCVKSTQGAGLVATMGLEFGAIIIRKGDIRKVVSSS